MRRSFFLFAPIIAVAAAGCARTRPVQTDVPASIASTDPVVIERGRYLAYGPGHCVACHTPDGPLTAFTPGEQPALTGGFTFRLPGISLVTPNLTPDAETGIGRRTDAELVRMLRHGVRADGSKAVPIMEYQNLSEEDVTALVSFLRSQPPVRNEVPGPKLNLMGRFGMAVVVKSPKPDGAPRVTSPAEGPSVERGAYLANNVANCHSCHTKRGATGAYKGARFAGGLVMAVEGDPKHKLVTPNLTPDPETGVLAAWSEEQFVARFRSGERAVKGSHMPWSAYATMSENDLRSIFRYLRSLEPVRRETRPTLRAR